MRYILHYTKPGDIVFDGFCGTGMTGVAAQMCGNPDPSFKAQLEVEMKDSQIQWGARKAILNDLSPAATFIAYNYNTPVDVNTFEKEAKRILAESEDELGWMYETQHVDEYGKPVLGLDGKPIMGRINYTVWSDVFVCPTCSNEIDFYDVAFDAKTGKVSDEFICIRCKSKLIKRECKRATTTFFDPIIKEVVTQVKQNPKLVSYSVANRKYLKPFSLFDSENQSRIDDYAIGVFVPVDKWIEGEKPKEPIKLGLNRIYQMYSKRNLSILADLLSRINDTNDSTRYKILFTSQLINISKLNRFRPGVSFPYNPLNGTLYIASMYCDSNPYIAYSNKLQRMVEAFSLIKGSPNCISCSSLNSLSILPINSIDYIFTDPPFGSNLNYSELSNIWESWLKVKTNNKQEAIINTVQKKGLPEYQQLMEECFEVCYNALKPQRWMTVEFHNSKNSIWNVIQESLLRVGFIVADVRIIDKQLGSLTRYQCAKTIVFQ